MMFVRKVYSILAVQLMITAAFIILVQTSSSMNLYVRTPAGQGVAIACAVGSIAFLCTIICCFGRVAPLNMILLLGYTLCMSYMVGGLTARYDPKIVMMAGLAAALVTIALTIYAIRTKTNIEVFAAMAFVVYLAMFPLIIIGIIIRTPFLHTLYCVLGLIFYSLYLIIDTIIICGKEKHNGVEMDKSDYVIGAMMLYIDIIMIFIYILQLLGDR